MTDIYAPPGASLALPSDTADTALLSFSGRIGRVRWFAYTATGMVVSVLSLAFLASRISRHDPVLNGRIGWCATLSVIAIICIMSMRRLHDLGKPRLSFLFLLLPGVNFYFLYLMAFRAGDPGTNAYGPVPRPNDRAAYLMCCSVVLVLAALYTIVMGTINAAR